MGDLKSRKTKDSSASLLDKTLIVCLGEFDERRAD